MKSVINVFTRGCVYAVLLAIIVCLFGLGASVEPSIPITQFLLILFIGEVISLSQEIFRIHALRPFLRLLIHFITLLVSFLILFLVTDKITTGGAGGIFIFVTLFTLIYAIIFAGIALIKSRLHIPVFAPQVTEKKQQKSTVYIFRISTI